MNDGERVRVDAFRREIAAHWQPATPAEQWLELRSRAVHLWSSLFDGAVTLQSVGVAAVLTAIGSAVLTVFPPTDAAFDSQVPGWIDAGLTVTIAWFAAECLASPRAVHRLRFAAVAMAMAIFAIAESVTTRLTAPADVIFFAALLVQGVGGLVGGAGAALRREPWLHLGMGVVGIGALGVTLGDGVWTATFALGRDSASALGCALAACGCMMMANGLVFARPAVRAR